MYWPLESRIQAGRNGSESERGGDGGSLVAVLVSESKATSRFEGEFELVSEPHGDGSRIL